MFTIINRDSLQRRVRTFTPSFFLNVLEGKLTQHITVVMLIVILTKTRKKAAREQHILDTNTGKQLP